MSERSIDPITWTVIIFALTLIAAVAIGGFVFGIFGSAGESAQVEITAISCRNDVNGTNCIFQLTNSGTGAATLTKGFITVSGTNYAGACPIVNITPNEVIGIMCLFKTGLVPQQEALGTLDMSDGAALIYDTAIP